jgi:hypothetical protein
VHSENNTAWIEGGLNTSNNISIRHFYLPNQTLVGFHFRPFLNRNYQLRHTYLYVDVLYNRFRIVKISCIFTSFS